MLLRSHCTTVGTPLTHENDAAVNVGFFNTELNASNSNLYTMITNSYKQFVDGEITKIDTTQLVKKAGDTMSRVLNMNGNKINNVGTPDTDENDAAVNVGFFNAELNASNTNLTNAYKQYVDHSNVSPSGLQRDAFRYFMEDTDDSSSENNIQVTE